jgi:hypothetical protein
MSTNKFLTVVNGNTILTQAVTTSAGVADANKIPSLDTNGTLSPTFLPSGIDLQTVVLPTSENLATGDFINIFDDSGTVKARKADASNGREARGYVLTAVTSPANATIYLTGRNTGVISASVGPVYLSATTPGGFSSTQPATAGPDVLLQPLGHALSPTSILFEYDRPIKLTVV